MVVRKCIHLRWNRDFWQKHFLRGTYRGRRNKTCSMFNRMETNADANQEKFLRLNKESQGIQGQWRGIWWVTALIKRSDSAGCSEKVSPRAVKNCQTWSSTLNPWPDIGPQLSSPKAVYLGHSFSSPSRHVRQMPNVPVQQWDVIPMGSDARKV